MKWGVNQSLFSVYFQNFDSSLQKMHHHLDYQQQVSGLD